MLSGHNPAPGTRSITRSRRIPQVHLEQQEEEEEETESATLEEYAFQLEVALQRERHVNASLHEQLICMHQDCQAEVEYSQAEAEYQAEHEYASYTNQLLHDREELLGQVRRWHNAPGAVLRQKWQAAGGLSLNRRKFRVRVHLRTAAAEGDNRLRVLCTAYCLSVHNRVHRVAQLAWLEDAAEKEVESLRYNLHLSHEALADAQEAAEHNMAAAQHYEAAAEHYHQQACRMQQYLMQLQGEQVCVR
jgi:hypothetical protein